MSFITPFFLLLGLLAIPIIILYMLRLRRQELTVSSTMLWQRLLRDREANSPWQKLRRNILLLLQLLILAALVFALARPFIPVPAIVSGSVVVLLDGSASMQATDVEPTRFEVAKTQVRDLIGTLSGTDQMTIIQVGQTPTVLISASSDKNALRQAVAGAEVGAGEADWGSGVALATGAAQGFTDARIAVISDGGLPDNLPPLPAETVYVPIGISPENLAITALATRNTADGVQLFASVANYGTISQEGLLTIRVNGVLFDSKRVEVNIDTTSNLTWQLPTDTATITAELSDVTQDFLADDNHAFAVHEGGVQNRTLIVTPGNLFLEQIFGVLPGIKPFKTGPDTDLTDPDAEPFDLYVFDSVSLPAPLPNADILIVNPVESYTSLFEITGAFSDTATIGVADNAILQFVDWSSINIRQAQRVSANWMQTLVNGQGGPLILAGERGNYRLAMITFDLHNSDLPLQVAYPILMSNITNWLNPGRAFDNVGALQPGDPVALSPSASATHLIINKPDGESVRLEVTERELIFAETEQFGLYTVDVEDESGVRNAGTFPVNLFSPSESKIAPATTINLGAQAVEATGEEGDVGQWELWTWLAMVAFVVLVVEWWVHHRGTRLPKLADFTKQATK